MNRTWHRAGRFSSTYWWSDSKHSFACVSKIIGGWYVSAYGHDVPTTPFRTLRLAKEWIEQNVPVMKKRGIQG